MAIIDVSGLQVGYDIVGTGEKTAIITPGGRFTRDATGLRELGERLSEGGMRLIIWDRPNSGESDICFEGESESVVNADTMVGLLRALNVGPTYVVGGSAGARIAALAAVRHPEMVKKMFLFWISGGMIPVQLLAWVYYVEIVRCRRFWRHGSGHPAPHVAGYAGKESTEPCEIPEL